MKVKKRLGNIGFNIICKQRGDLLFCLTRLWNYLKEARNRSSQAKSLFHEVISLFTWNAMILEAKESVSNKIPWTGSLYPIDFSPYLLQTLDFCLLLFGS